MTDSTVDNRELIDRELTSNLIVEAAAGTGKTTKLVDRVTALIEQGLARIGEIVAVTFTEKAAGELKLRLRERLELSRANTPPDGPVYQRISDAIHDFEESHVSTIHGFCVELLRERPVEAGVDPSFQVLTEGAGNSMFDEIFWLWLHRDFGKMGEGVRRSLRRTAKPVFGEDDDYGPIQRLRRIARDLREWRHYPAPWSRPLYDREHAIRELIRQLQAFSELTASPIKRGDVFAEDTKIARITSSEIQRQRKQVGDMIPPTMFDLWEAKLIDLGTNYRFRKRVRKGSGAAFAMGVTRDQALAAHQNLLDALETFKRDADADLAALLREELRACFDLYEKRKHATGVLDFVDLLVKARDLVRGNHEVRAHFQSKYHVLLVDEFQDTDSLQAELLTSLVSDDRGRIEPGRLFVVGDPKQSIYRFRRADIGAYGSVIASMAEQGATRVTLKRSFRSVPAIQNFVNAAFASEMTGSEESQQANYVPLARHRAEYSKQPAIIALPVPQPYNYREVTATELMRSEPPAVAEFIRWMLSDECQWTVPDGHQRRRIKANDICLLLRRFVHFEKDITRNYMNELERRDVPHLLVGGRSFHQRDEVEALRNAITAIEWPEDQLSVYATLQGPLFAVGEQELLEYHSIAKAFHPYRIPKDLPDRLKPIVDALALLRRLHGARNHKPVADTIETLVTSTRAHAAFVLWRGGEQALANALQVIELARQYETEGGLSFRGFVDLLRESQATAESREAPVLEEGSEGVRIMSVHKAKGLEFPVVILADIACQLSRKDASRYLDTRRDLCAIRLAGWSPLDLLVNNDVEAKRDEAEGVRLSYVAATRAKDILVVPAVGDGPYNESWVRPLYSALYPPREDRQSPTSFPGVPLFKSKDTVIPEARPHGQLPDSSTVRPGSYEIGDPSSKTSYSVTWWDPQLLVEEPRDMQGIRREDLISKDANPLDVAADRARYDAWRTSRSSAQSMGNRMSTVIMTATEIARSAAERNDPVPEVVIEDAAQLSEARPSGKRFGTLVHALLATLPLDAGPSEAADLAALYAKLFAAPDAERDAAAGIGTALVKHPRWLAARAAADAGRRVWREAPVSLRVQEEPGQPITIVDGQVDLAYETEDGWVVVDFKTDIEIVSARDAYKQQVALYAEAVAKATGRPARGVLLRV